MADYEPDCSKYQTFQNDDGDYNVQISQLLGIQTLELSRMSLVMITMFKLPNERWIAHLWGSVKC